MSDFFMKKRAVISDCGAYRWTLDRTWDESLPTVVFIMLNPSTADGFEDDPTIRRCIRFARDWGFGSLSVLNLFALRATDPKGMKAHPAPVGDSNLTWLNAYLNLPRVTVVCAWGNHGTHMGQDKVVLELIRDSLARGPLCLGVTKQGQPVHPLYQPAKAAPLPYDTINKSPTFKGVEKKVVSIVGKILGWADEKIHATHLLVDDLDACDFDFWCLALEVEKKFGVMMPDFGPHNMKTVSDISTAVVKALGDDYDG